MLPHTLLHVGAWQILVLPAWLTLLEGPPRAVVGACPCNVVQAGWAAQADVAGRVAKAMAALLTTGHPPALRATAPHEATRVNIRGVPATAVIETNVDVSRPRSSGTTPFSRVRR